MYIIIIQTHLFISHFRHAAHHNVLINSLNSFRWEATSSIRTVRSNVKVRYARPGSNQCHFPYSLYRHSTIEYRQTLVLLMFNNKLIILNIILPMMAQYIIYQLWFKIVRACPRYWRLPGNICMMKSQYSINIHRWSR